MTNEPNVAITSPALPPLLRISFVADKLSASLKSVVRSKSVGSTENSSAFFMKSVVAS